MHPSSIDITPSANSGANFGAGAHLFLLGANTRACARAYSLSNFCQARACAGIIVSVIVCSWLRITNVHKKYLLIIALEKNKFGIISIKRFIMLYAILFLIREKGKQLFEKKVCQLSISQTS
jgi:hypothetical protein